MYWGKYSEFHKEAFAVTNSASANTWITAYSISGNGYLAQCTSITGSGNSIMRITIDGIIIYQSQSSPSIVIGILLEKYKALNTTVGVRTTNAVNQVNATKEFPFVDTTTANTNAICFLPQPIFFKSSLIIEVKNTAAGSIVSNFIIKGGIK